MILSGNEILRQVTKGKIAIVPFDVHLINPNSYNYRLGPTLLEVTDSIINPRKKSSFKQINLTNTGYILKPNRLYLASTYEKIGSDFYVVSLIGRSSVGRLGLFVQITADMGNLGSKHNWTLELKVVQPLKIYPGMKIGQVSFWEVSGAVNNLYAGKYSVHEKPYRSKIYEELQGNIEA